MVTITKVYTKTGDKGATHLAAGEAIEKSSPRIAVIGDIDELNVALGFAAVALQEKNEFQVLQQAILRMQNELFDLGAWLAVPEKHRREDTPKIHAGDVIRLEREMDEMNHHLTPLTSFVLPNGNEISSRLHMARAICRRAERALVILNEVEPVHNDEIPYLNRVSDWLFIAARWANKMLDGKEKIWQPGKRENF